MRNSLPRKVNRIECGIVNLDDLKNKGTHWVAYAKFKDYCEYFDSFGDLKPPEEIKKYLNVCNIFYNYHRYQKFNTVNCGHLCLEFLQKFWNKHHIN